MVAPFQQHKIRQDLVADNLPSARLDVRPRDSGLALFGRPANNRGNLKSQDFADQSVALLGRQGLHLFEQLGDRHALTVASSALAKKASTAPCRRYRTKVVHNSSVPRMAEFWSLPEVELVVADYFAMLWKELAGLPIDKTAHRKALQPRLNGRSHGSIEFKHQNISAVLINFDQPYVNGYKPRQN